MNIDPEAARVAADARVPCLSDVQIMRACTLAYLAGCKPLDQTARQIDLADRLNIKADMISLGDGRMMAIEEIVSELNQRPAVPDAPVSREQALAALKEFERIEIYMTPTPRKSVLAALQHFAGETK